MLGDEDFVTNLQRVSATSTTHRRLRILLLLLKKEVHTRLASVGFRSWSRFLAVSLQVMWVINPVVGCHYFLPGSQIASQPLREETHYQFHCLVNRGTTDVNSLPKTVTRQRRSYDMNPGPSAPESSTLNHSATEPPYYYYHKWNVLIRVTTGTARHILRNQREIFMNRTAR